MGTYRGFYSTLGKLFDHDRHKCDRNERDLKAIEPVSNAYHGRRRVKYRLHAEFVHDGSRQSVHCLAFIPDRNSNEPARNRKKLSGSMVFFLTDEEIYASLTDWERVTHAESFSETLAMGSFSCLSSERRFGSLLEIISYSFSMQIRLRMDSRRNFRRCCSAAW